MSFLIFAYRKLSLKRQISDKSYRLMVLSEKYSQKTEQIGAMQQAISSGKNMINIFAQGSMMNLNNEFMQKYSDGKGGLTEEATKNQAIIQQEYQNKQYQAAMMSNMCNSVFEAASQAQMAQLNAENKRIDLEKNNLESQLKLLDGELKAVEQGEDAAAKQCAPKFGLS